MATCGSLRHIFENPMTENSLSPWNQIKSMKPIQDSSFTEIFGELHFKENNIESPSSSPIPVSSPSSSSSSSFLADANSNPGMEKLKNPTTTNYFPTNQTRQYRHSDSFSSMNSESLSLCTEGLGFESSDDVEDLNFKNEIENDCKHHQERINHTKHTLYEGGEFKRSRTSGGTFPPPISCIGRSGKPWVCFKSYRQDGRFILKEVRIQTQEFLHACRENGRLKLQFIQSDDQILEEDEEEQGQEEEEEEEEEINGEEKVEMNNNEDGYNSS